MSNIVPLHRNVVHEERIDLLEALARDALCSAEPEPFRERLYDGLFYLALGAMSATVLGLLVLWCQS